MKCLIIDNRTAYYNIGNDENQKKNITEINKDDLLVLIHKMVETDDEIDKYEESLIDNPAERVIYKNIYLKLYDLKCKKERFEDAKMTMYKEAIQKYTQSISQEECVEETDIGLFDENKDNN